MSDTPDTGLPILRVGPHNKGPIVVVTAYIFVIIAILTTLVRLIGVLARKRTLNLADGLSIIATLLALLQSISLNFAASYGLGRHMDSLSVTDTASFYKASYAAQLIAVAAVTFTKTSVLQLVHIIAPRQNVKPRLIIKGLVGFWVVFAIFSLAFQCGLQHPWVYTPQRCNNGGLVYAVVGLNIMTDIYLSVVFIPTIRGLRMKESARITLASLFLSRLLVCVAGIAELAFLPRTLSSLDQSWTQTTVVIIRHVIMDMSVITANLPSLRRFLYDLQSGQNGARLGDRQAGMELSSESWGRSKNDASRSNGSSGQWKPVSHQSQHIHTKAQEVRSNNGSEDGILRVVDVTINLEERSRS